MKILLSFALITITLSACAKKTTIEHRFSMKYYEDSEVQVCVDDPILLVEINPEQTDLYYDTIDRVSYQISPKPEDALGSSVVDYEHCLPQDKRIRNFSTKKINDVEVCYERISKIELPMSYCLPDTNVNVHVSQYTNVSQSLKYY
jgi:hypothetical protein